ncbi:unnamed protein product [marine sediment metagenome]|uniref:Uncharacterized protein n=1 Tax=marine sediment metagenome TaxID=412755 RepID=X1RZW0_9ZZZZ
MTGFILRPNAPGYQCEISNEEGDPCPNHWNNVNDIIPDGDITVLWQTVFGWKNDLYKIEAPPLHGFSNKGVSNGKRGVKPKG